MNNTFNFKRDHPKYYAHVQRTKRKNATKTAAIFIISVIVNLALVVLLMPEDLAVLGTPTDIGVHIFLMAWVCLTTPLAITTLVQWARI